jgi:hypothetical protein
MRAASIAAALVLLVTPQVTFAKEAPKPEQVPGPSPSRADTTEDTAALGKAARERDEARQRAWDKKTRSITRGICSGC